jgi:hypothetical protein
MNDLQQAKDILTLLDKIADMAMDDLKNLLSFISLFTEKRQKALLNQAYHINLIDELHASENAHSRILAKLLQQKTPSGKFEILESFVRYIIENPKGKSVSFGNIHIENPDITNETERIDLWIRDKGYSIIVENKIHRAPDQPEQLSRYIESAKAFGHSEQQIYIVYLSPTYDKTPDEQTWGLYKDTFSERFIHLSFRDDILTWLINIVLPNVRLKDKYLSSALEQYIDHLEGMFDLRITNNKMNMELQEFIKQELGLTGTSQENYAKLEAKQKEINDLCNQINMIKKKVELDILNEWKSTLKKNFACYEQIDREDRAGIIIPINGTSVRVLSIIEREQLYCQVDMDHLDKEKRNIPPEVEESVKHLLPENEPGPHFFKAFPCNAYNETFDVLCKVIEILIDRFR